MKDYVIDNIENIDQILNVNLDTAQFNAGQLIEEAKKIGIDFGELEDYGFDKTSQLCGGRTCPGKKEIIEVNRLLNGTENKFLEVGL